MTTLTNPEKLTLLLNMSEELLVAAQQGEWERVDEIDKQRMDVLPNFSDYTFNSDDEVEDIQQKIERIIEINQCIVELGSVARKQHMQDNRKVATGRQAVNLYNSFS